MSETTKSRDGVRLYKIRLPLSLYQKLLDIGYDRVFNALQKLADNSNDSNNLDHVSFDWSLDESFDDSHNAALEARLDEMFGKD